MIDANVLDNSFVNVKFNTYDNNCNHISMWLDKMYLFKQDTLHYGVIDATKIDQ